MFSKFWNNLVKESRTLWALVVSLIVIVLYVVWPQFPLSQEMVTGALTLLVGFTVAEGLEGWRPASGVWSTLWKSRKFKLVVAGFAVIFIKALVPADVLSMLPVQITPDNVLALVNAIVAIVLGLGFEGAVSAFKGAK